MWNAKRWESKRGGKKQHSSLQPSSLPRAHHQPRSPSALRLHPPLLFATYLKIACPSGDKVKRADGVAVCDGNPIFPRLFFPPHAFCVDWCSSFAQYQPGANPPHTKSRKWLQVHFLKGQSQCRRRWWEGPRHVDSSFHFLLLRKTYFAYRYIRNAFQNLHLLASEVVGICCMYREKWHSNSKVGMLCKLLKTKLNAMTCKSHKSIIYP